MSGEGVIDNQADALCCAKITDGSPTRAKEGGNAGA